MMTDSTSRDEVHPSLQVSELHQAPGIDGEDAEAGYRHSPTEDREDGQSAREDVTAGTESYTACDSEEVDMDRLQKAMSSLMVSIKICGLHFTRGCSRAAGKTKTEEWRVTPSMTYSTLLLCLIWLDFIRGFFVFSSGVSVDVEFFNKLLFVIWNALVCANFTTFYHGSLSQGFPSFLGGWVQLVLKDSRCLEKVRKSAQVHALLSWILLIANMVYSVCSIYLSNTFDYQYTPFDEDHDQIDLLRAALVVLHLMRSCAWVFAPALFCVVCRMLTLHFNTLTEEFAQQKREQVIFGRLEHFRQRHQKMCNLIDVANGITSPLIAAQFAFNVALICVMLYLLIWSQPSNRPSTATGCFWLVTSAGSMMIFCVGAAKVNSAAHSLLDHLHDLDLTKSDRDVSCELSLFTNKLSGSSIGFTACGLFTVDTSSILTLFGSLLTYFLLMIDYAPVDDDADPNRDLICNCTLAIINSTTHCINLN